MLWGQSSHKKGNTAFKDSKDPPPAAWPRCGCHEEGGPSGSLPRDWPAARGAAAGRDGRKGYRELNVTKLDNADLQEFLDVVIKVENYYFSFVQHNLIIL